MSGYSIFDVVKDTIKGEVEKSDATIIAERISICNICPEYKPMLGVCGNCGCIIKYKVSFAKSSCPLNKW